MPSPKHLATATVENVSPSLGEGRFPVKRVVGEELPVAADVFKDGHDITTAVLKWRMAGERRWNETAMRPLGNDRWTATCAFHQVGLGEFTVEAYTERWLSWRHEWQKKFDAGVRPLTTETEEAALLLEGAAHRAKKMPADAARLRELAALVRAGAPEEVHALAALPELAALMAAFPDRSDAHEMKPAHPVRVDRPAARFAAWYEFFPRSAEGRGDRGSTFRDCLPRIDAAKAMGFDVIYFPPIHPIGTANRKGRNNSVTCEPGEPGCPYAIGSPDGGHFAVAPELGTLKDFEWLVKRIRERGMELALDFAINCSPDHPWVRDHPDWFFHRPDGTIKYAENPPKKYEDIYPLNYICADWKALWNEMRDVLLFWAGKGVRIFRVDNPHTKPVAMWEYVIAQVQKRFPDVIFLSEAFTRPKVMRALAKSGFTQSYTYFTWRNTKQELIEYLTELTQSEMRWYFRGNLWPNTPDILPWALQSAPRNAFLIRFALAALLSPVYGMFSGFELAENQPFPGKEEYWDSDKYQWRERDWDAPGNLKNWITLINKARHEERALQLYDNLRFHPASNDQVLFFSKMTPSRDSVLLIAVSLDPKSYQGAHVEVPVEELGLPPGRDEYIVHDLLTGHRYHWRGRRNFVGLPPDWPAHVLRVEA